MHIRSKNKQKRFIPQKEIKQLNDNSKQELFKCLIILLEGEKVSWLLNP
jgi:hypothetical protein